MSSDEATTQNPGEPALPTSSLSLVTRPPWGTRGDQRTALRLQEWAQLRLLVKSGASSPCARDEILILFCTFFLLCSEARIRSYIMVQKPH